MDSWHDNYVKNKNAIWIIVRYKNGSNRYLQSIQEWMSLVKENTFLDDLNGMSLRFRSHEYILETVDLDGVYLCNCILATLTSSRDTIVFGQVRGLKIKKDFILVPELIVEDSDTGEIDDCFPELIMWKNEKKKNGKE